MTGIKIHQRTIGHWVRTQGIGLHRGRPVFMTFYPGEVDSGIVLRVRGLGDVAARWENVADTRMNTTLGGRGFSVSTVEHVLAAIAGCGIDNMVIEVDGDEMPAMDGSSRAFTDMIRRVGIVEQKAHRRFIVVDAPIEVRDGERFIVAEPCSQIRYDYSIDFTHPSIGKQRYVYEHHYEHHSIRDFCEQVAPARTFGFLSDVERLRAAGLALGSGENNVIVLSDGGVMNKDGLRFRDEFVRHKLLDAWGDLYLAGCPIVASLRFHRAGHDLHHRFLKTLFSKKDAWHETDEYPQVHRDVAVNE